MKASASSLQSTRLPDQIRERVQHTHYSLNANKNYTYWIRFFIRQSITQGGEMRHARDMSVTEVDVFLSVLVDVCRRSTATHNHAIHRPRKA
jgi:hypothetical protein